MKPTLAKEVVLDALLMAIWRRRRTEPVIVHSDQGTQYGSDEHRFVRNIACLYSALELILAPPILPLIRGHCQANNTR